MAFKDYKNKIIIGGLVILGSIALSHQITKAKYFNNNSAVNSDAPVSDENSNVYNLEKDLLIDQAQDVRVYLEKFIDKYHGDTNQYVRAAVENANNLLLKEGIINHYSTVEPKEYLSALSSTQKSYNEFEKIINENQDSTLQSGLDNIVSSSLILK